MTGSNDGFDCRVDRRHDRLHGLGGAADTETFGTYVEAVLVHTLRPWRHGGDGQSLLHKSDPTLGLIPRAGAFVLFLPAYSPDLNPIEKMWSKIKSLLRTAESRTAAELITAVGQALAKVTAQHVMGWFVSRGYSFC